VRSRVARFCIADWDGCYGCTGVVHIVLSPIAAGDGD
jgi:hypothetical protein